jgi:hypothetical protein
MVLTETPPCNYTRVIFREALMQELRNDFAAPAVLADRCDTFAAEIDEPGICAGCGWLRDEHLEHPEPLAA